MPGKVMPGELMPVDTAIAEICGQAKLLVDHEDVPLMQALGRVLAEDIVARINVPLADNSAMDGYAVCAADVRVDETVPVSDRIPAGTVGKPLMPGTAARIFTGAPLPEGADAIVIQEDTSPEGESVRLHVQPSSGDHVRMAGQDICAGQTILQQGRRLRAADIGLIASVGVDVLQVYRRLKVGVMSTGDELVDPPGELAPGQIYNSNHYTLQNLVLSLGMEPVDLGLVADTPAATEAALEAGHARSDVILSSGGVSVGEEDHVKAAVEKLGDLGLWRLAIKPGKPLAFGNIASTPFFGLPGNPVSGFVTFMMIARPFLLASQGCLDHKLTTVYGIADFSASAGKRREYLRVQVEFDDTGQGRVMDYQNQGSGVMSSVSWANGLAVLEVGQSLTPGDSIKVLLLP